MSEEEWLVKIHRANFHVDDWSTFVSFAGGDREMKPESFDFPIEGFRLSCFRGAEIPRLDEVERSEIHLFIVDSIHPDALDFLQRSLHYIWVEKETIVTSLGITLYRQWVYVCTDSFAKKKVLLVRKRKTLLVRRRKGAQTYDYVLPFEDPQMTKEDCLDQLFKFNIRKVRSISPSNIIFDDEPEEED